MPSSADRDQAHRHDRRARKQLPRSRGVRVGRAGCPPCAGPVSSARQAIPTTPTTVSSHIQSIAGRDRERRERRGERRDRRASAPRAARSRRPPRRSPPERAHRAARGRAGRARPASRDRASGRRATNFVQRAVLGPPRLERAGAVARRPGAASNSSTRASPRSASGRCRRAQQVGLGEVALGDALLGRAAALKSLNFCTGCDGHHAGQQHDRDGASDARAPLAPAARRRAAARRGRSSGQ